MNSAEYISSNRMYSDLNHDSDKDHAQQSLVTNDPQNTDEEFMLVDEMNAYEDSQKEVHLFDDEYADMFDNLPSFCDRSSEEMDALQEDYLKEAYRIMFEDKSAGERIMCKKEDIAIKELHDTEKRYTKSLKKKIAQESACHSDLHSAFTSISLPVYNIDFVNKNKHEVFGIMIYTVNPSTEKDLHGIVKSPYRSNQSNEVDKMNRYEKFCIPCKWKTFGVCTLKQRLVSFVDEFEQGTIWLDDENKPDTFISTHVLFIREDKYSQFFSGKRMKPRLIAEKSIGPCTLIMRGLDSENGASFNISSEMSSLIGFRDQFTLNSIMRSDITI